MNYKPKTKRDAVRYVAREYSYFEKNIFYREKVKEEFGLDVCAKTVSESIGSWGKRLTSEVRNVSPSRAEKHATKLLRATDYNLPASMKILQRTAGELEQKEDDPDTK